MPYSSQRDLRGKHPNDTYPYMVSVDGTGSLFDGTGSQVTSVNVTSSFSVSASYEILYELSSSYAESSSVSSTAKSYDSNTLTLNNNNDPDYGGTLVINHGTNYGSDVTIGSEVGNLVLLNVGNLTIDGNIMPVTTDTFDLGESGNNWNTIFVNSLRGSVTGSVSGSNVRISQLFVDGNVTASIISASIVSAGSGMVLPTISSAPVDSPAAGTMRYDSTNNELYVYNGTSWKTVSLA